MCAPRKQGAQPQRVARRSRPLAPARLYINRGTRPIQEFAASIFINIVYIKRGPKTYSL